MEGAEAAADRAQPRRRPFAAELRALREVLQNEDLHRLELAWIGSVLGQWSYTVAVGVFAFEQEGVGAVGLASLVRFVPAAVAAPFAGALADRWSRKRLLLAADALRITAMAAAAGVELFFDQPLAVIFALTAVVAVASTCFEPCKAALLPQLARTPEELTSANLTARTVRNVGAFAAPALGGLLLALTGPAAVFAAAACAFGWSAFFIARVRDPSAAERPGRPAVRGIGREVASGLRAIVGDGRLRLLTAVLGAQSLVAGAVNVLIVVTALELLGIGVGGVGYLTAAAGAGSVLGGAAAIALGIRRRLDAGLALGAALGGAPVALIAVWPEPVAAVVLLALVGAGDTLLATATVTLMQRAVPDAVLARVFGTVEAAVIGTLGVGAVCASTLIDGFGVSVALVVSGLFLPGLALALWPFLRRVEAAAVEPGNEIELLRALPVFSPLPEPTLEQLSSSLVPVSAEPGEEVIREGEPGDRFYVIASGRAEVDERGEWQRTQGPGEAFGEIALLRDVPRTATVRAVTPLRLLTLERDEFIAAVSGHARSSAAADALIGARLGDVRRGVSSV